MIYDKNKDDLFHVREDGFGRIAKIFIDAPHVRKYISIEYHVPHSLVRKRIRIGVENKKLSTRVWIEGRWDASNTLTHYQDTLGNTWKIQWEVECPAFRHLRYLERYQQDAYPQLIMRALKD